MQSKLDSLKESITNIVIGLAIALLAQLGYFYMFDIGVTLNHNLGLAAWMTVISLTRSYFIRRWYNRKTVAQLSNKT